MALDKSARACGGADPNRVGGQLTFAEKKRARGMLADKQGVGSIAEELECSVAQIQALADAKPKPVCAIATSASAAAALPLAVDVCSFRSSSFRCLCRVLSALALPS